MPRSDRKAPPPLRVALTGGIASGKSTVAALFATLGVPVIDTDVVAREVVAPGTAGLAAVTARFGTQILDGAGGLDRARLRGIVFADPAARRDLEGLLHPLIRERTAALSRAAGGAYQIVVVPLLVETGTAEAYDRVAVVDCEPATQLARLLLRDGASQAEAEAILAAQATRESRLARADDVIENTSDLPALARQVEALHRRYLQLATAPRGATCLE